MKKYFFVPFCIISVLATLQSNAQVSDPQVLMTVGTRPVSLQEFKAMYYKNLPKDSAKSKKALDNYLSLYTEFRLKVNAAIDARLDTTPSFKQEMNEYRQKLADPYMRDTAVQNNLVKEAYERMKTDVQASHILIKLSTDALPADTLAAYNKALKIREDIVKKQITFEEAAKKYSMDDRSASHGGEIGYFTALETYYPFENALYNTKVGDISMPIHTPLGYHLIKVTDKKVDAGQILVAHIMIRTPVKMQAADSLKLKTKIDSLYMLVKQGQDFADLAKKYSQDPSSGKHGGALPWFGVGRMPAPFEVAAFSLKNVGDVSAPIRTAYGWHIVKLLGKKGVPAFNDSVKESITSKVLRDDRSEQSVNALVREIKQKYEFKEDPKAKEDFYKVVDETFYTNKWTVDKAKDLTKTMFTLGGKSITQQDFAQYLSHNQVTGENKGGEVAVNRLYPKFVKEQCLKFKNDRLEKEYPSFAEMIDEYRDGILLFDITDKMVWTKALKDTTGLKAYHEQHKNAYMWGERADASIFTCSDEKVAKEVKKLIKEGKTDKEILAAVNAKDANSASVQGNMYEKKDNAMVDANWKQGISENQTVNGKIVFVDVRKIVPPTPKSLDDVRGMVTTDYQNYLMSQWLTELRSKYPVTVNQQVLGQVMTQ
ncbi:MAG TPA: peptidylprolyl isomerase [Bacteroidia bacterium]|nr:peptidylprolyl isomerase [Bacteroidia bacterium]